MSKPWEETWVADTAHGWVTDSEGRSVANVFHEATSLIACSPEMARMLLEHEWDGTDHGMDEYCVECDSRREFGHADDCALDALLRKAGMRP